jgi:outer membrane protein assembly factor BamB
MCGGNLQKTNISNSKNVLTPPFSLLWEFSLEAGVSKNSISASDGVVFINTLNGELQALNITNGKSLGSL